MKKVLRWSLYIVGVIVLVVIALLGYVSFALPNVGPPPQDLTVEITPERVERGEYLANHVMLCMDCHVIRDFSLYAGPPVPGTEGAGGEIFDQSMGFPGKFVSRNITPSGLGEWTDGEIYRAITCGVSKDGSALFPIMPYPNFAKMDEEDIKSVIAYLRALTPIEKENSVSKPDFPFNIILNTMPKKAEGGKMPPKSDKVAYGEYLLNAAGCAECHTNQLKGKIIGEYLTGGFEFQMPDGSVIRSVNITPHETGIGLWSEEQFVDAFKMYVDSSYVIKKVQPGEMQTIMPWLMYGGMEEEDLKAIYAYLKTVNPVANVVERFSPPPAN